MQMLIELAGLCSNHRMKNSSPTFSPLYRQIKSLAIQALASGEWQPGQAIPSEQELAQRFQVSPGTVRKAIDEMVAENLLMRRQGKGTFVTSHTDPRALFRFLRLTPDSGERVPLENIPFDCRHARAGQEVARNLDLEPGAPVVIVRRVLRDAGKPIVADEIFLPEDLFQDLDFEMLEAWKGSLYSLFETRFGQRMITAREKIRAVAADRIAAEALGVAEGTAVLLVERVAFSYAGRPVEWRRGLYLTTDHYYQNELN